MHTKNKKIRILKTFVFISGLVLSSASGYGSDNKEPDSPRHQKFTYELVFKQRLEHIKTQILPAWKEAHTKVYTSAKTQPRWNTTIDEQDQPTCFISFSYPVPAVLKPLYKALKRSGLHPLCSAYGDNSAATSISDFARKTTSTNYVIFVATPDAMQKYNAKTGIVATEMSMIFQRSLTLYNSIFILLVEGDQNTALTADFADKVWIPYQDANNYFREKNPTTQNVKDYLSFCSNTLDLIQQIYTRNIFSSRGAKTEELLHSSVKEKFNSLFSFNKMIEVAATNTNIREKVNERKAEKEKRRTQKKNDINAQLDSLSLSTSSTSVRSTNIPVIAQGYEAIYQRFLNGALIYRPTPGSDVGKIVLPIKDLKPNPLEGMFDLSKCGNTGKYLSISTGYRKGKKPENKDKDKVEIWFAPRFLIEKEINTTAKHFQAILPAKWNADVPVGIFWTWSDWNNLTDYDYLTSEAIHELGAESLYEKWSKSVVSHQYECDYDGFLYETGQRRKGPYTPGEASTYHDHTLECDFGWRPDAGAGYVWGFRDVPRSVFGHYVFELK